MTTDTRLEAGLELIEADLQVAIANQRETMGTDLRVLDVIRVQREQMAHAARIEELANSARSEHARTLLKVRG